MNHIGRIETATDVGGIGVAAVDDGTQTQFLTHHRDITLVRQFDEDTAVVVGILFDEDFLHLDVDELVGKDIGGVVGRIVIAVDMDKGVDDVVAGRTRRQHRIEAVVASVECCQGLGAIVGLVHHVGGVIVNPEAHLEVVDATCTHVVDDESNMGSVVVGGVDDERRGGYVGNRHDTFGALGDSVVIDVVVGGALDDCREVHHTHGGRDATMEGVVEILERLERTSQVLLEVDYLIDTRDAVDDKAGGGGVDGIDAEVTHADGDFHRGVAGDHIV